jgi:hypothetical protein
MPASHDKPSKKRGPRAPKPDKAALAASTAKRQVPAQLAAFAFQPGQSGNPAGRKPGTRNQFGEAFIQALHADFEEHGAETIQTVRQEDPGTYLRVCASVLPKEIKVDVSDLEKLNDDQLDKRIHALANAIGLAIGAGAGARGEAAEAGAKPAGGVSAVH